MLAITLSSLIFTTLAIIASIYPVHLKHPLNLTEDLTKEQLVAIMWRFGVYYILTFGASLLITFPMNYEEYNWDSIIEERLQIN